jgi:ubiquinone biosynthesis protein COQ4
VAIGAGEIAPNTGTLSAIDITVSYLHPATMIPTTFRDSRRPSRRFRPFKAFGHFRKLIADKEDTAQVFHMVDCLPSPKFRRMAEAFCASEKGRALMASETWLPDVLDDHDALLKLPEGSVGQAYVAFMRREGLSASGLVAESEEQFPDRKLYKDQTQWVDDRLRDTHDLIHVLTGYGRDALGEQCALGFSSSQYPGLTDWFLAWAGAFELKRRVKTDAPVFAAVGEARRNGKAAQRIFMQDVRSLLAEPLDVARKRLNIGGISAYQDSHRAYRASGYDPYDFMAGQAPA